MKRGKSGVFRVPPSQDKHAAEERRLETKGKEEMSSKKRKRLQTLQTRKPMYKKREAAKAGEE